MTIEEALCELYGSYCEDEGIPYVSADEQDYDALTQDQRLWIDGFIRLWDFMREREQEGRPITLNSPADTQAVTG